MALLDYKDKPTPLYSTLKGEAHIYLAFSYKNNDPKLLSSLKNLLTDEELEKQKSFYRHSDQHLYLLAHGLIRIILSKYCAIDPKIWKFTYNEYGRPEIKYARINHNLRFSLSRTRNLVGFLIVNSIDCGIDVEEVKSFKDLKLISEKILSIHEQMMLKKLNLNDQLRKFFSLWTLKEAFIKAKGKGLSIPLNSFSFQIDDKKRINLIADPGIDDLISKWQFFQFQPSITHVGAIALKGLEDLKIRIYEIIQESGDFSFLPLNWVNSLNLN